MISAIPSLPGCRILAFRWKSEPHYSGIDSEEWATIHSEVNP